MVKTFEFWEKSGFLEFHQGNVRIYRVEGEQYLFVDQTLYASTTERSWYIQNIMPYVKGKCLEIGLGLGVASKVILANPQAQSLLTIEKNDGVIAAFGKPLYKHMILQQDINEWLNWPRLRGNSYDFIFVDHFANMEDEEYEEVAKVVDKLKWLLRSEGKLIVWLDENAPEEDIQKFRDFWVV